MLAVVVVMLVMVANGDDDDQAKEQVIPHAKLPRNPWRSGSCIVCGASTCTKVVDGGGSSSGHGGKCFSLFYRP